MSLGIWAILAAVVSIVGFSWIMVLSFADSKDPLFQDEV